MTSSLVRCLPFVVDTALMSRLLSPIDSGKPYSRPGKTDPGVGFFCLGHTSSKKDTCEGIHVSHAWLV